MRHNFNKDQISQLLKENDGNLTTVTKKLNVSHGALRHFVIKNNIQYKSQRPALPSKEILKEAYSRLGSLSLVAKEINSTKDGVRKAMKRLGLEINKPILYSCNHDFFNLNNQSEEQFYWAGFIAADGCVKKRKSSECYELQIGLAEKDKSHIEKFKNSINSESPIKIFTVKNSLRNSEWNDTCKAEICIASKKIFNDLAKFNIVPKKSLIYNFPEFIINHPLLNHFMRGYFDGDGSFYFSKNKNIEKQAYFNLRGTQNFLLTYRKILENNCDLKIRNNEIRINNGIGVLEYGGNNILSRISNFLYKDANVYLERKFNIIKCFL